MKNIVIIVLVIAVLALTGTLFIHGHFDSKASGAKDSGAPAKSSGSATTPTTTEDESLVIAGLKEILSKGKAGGSACGAGEIEVGSAADKAHKSDEMEDFARREVLRIRTEREMLALKKDELRKLKNDLLVLNVQIGETRNIIRQTNRSIFTETETLNGYRNNSSLYAAQLDTVQSYERGLAGKQSDLVELVKKVPELETKIRNLEAEIASGVTVKFLFYPGRKVSRVKRHNALDCFKKLKQSRAFF